MKMARESFWKIVDELDALVAENGTRQLVYMDDDELKAWERPAKPLYQHMEDDERWFTTRVGLHLERGEGTPIEFVEAAEAIFRKAKSLASAP
jgi:hypothetical protein